MPTVQLTRSSTPSHCPIPPTRGLLAGVLLALSC